MKRTKQIIEAEEQALTAELTGIEKKILELHDREHHLRNELQHIVNQKERLDALMS